MSVLLIFFLVGGGGGGEFNFLIYEMGWGRVGEVAIK